MKEQKLEDLKKQFDRVVLFHSTKTIKRTIAILVKGNVAFVGVSKCADEDMFSRRRGRQIALGRALFAYEVSLGKEQERTITKRSEVLSFARVVDITQKDVLAQIFPV